MNPIIYDNAYSQWYEALPIGNGRMGAMIYLTRRALIIDVNHYDIYYRTLSMYRSSGPKRPAGVSRPQYSYTVDDIRARALEARSDPSSPAHNNYNYVMNPATAEQYGVMRSGSSHPLTAEIEIRFGRVFPGEFRQELDLERGMYRFEATSLSVEAFITEDDRLLVELRDREPAGGTVVEIRHPERRLLRKVTVYEAGEQELSFTTTLPDHDSFQFKWRLRVDSSSADSVAGSASAMLSLPESEERVVLSGCVFTGAAVTGGRDEERADPTPDYDAAKERHAERWRRFWSASSVTLPDKMLERLWYLNLYSLRCCNGEGAELFEQACGLNGLWDIKQPSQWGSMWYWDVNIQQAFWPIYTANHPETGYPFYRALESYIPKAEERAREFYGIEGIAGDYPFAFYFCLWPWCAQHFWWHYRYTKDEEFLRTRAFPLFEKIIRFYRAFMTWNEETGRYELFPDISPEQGPVTKNATISIGTLKYLLKATLEAGEVLGADARDQADRRHMLEHLPDYAIGESETYGSHIKDSEWTEPDIYMAHSSPLMVIYPIGEYGKRTPEMKELLANTVRWMECEQNLGTHNFGWLAAVYARLGDGDSALRMLYEKGIAYQMRANGLFAEETDRWMQNCLTACLPVYNPPLIEAGSVVVAAVNEMLLQSMGGLVEVFPAVPQGTVRTENARYDMSAMAGEVRSPEWRDCRFDRLRAEGGYLVSSELVDGSVAWVEVVSESGGRFDLLNPFDRDAPVACRTPDGSSVACRLEEGVVSLDTTPGGCYRLRPVNAPEGTVEAHDRPENPSVLSVITRERRRVYLGKDRNTDFVRTLDAMTHDYYAGDQRVSPISVYRFDFSTNEETLRKDYREILQRQFHGCGKMGLDFIRVTVDTELTPARGYGFDTAAGALQYVDRGSGDPLRRDFVQAEAPRIFRLELPRGIYKVLIVSGDPGGPTNTAVAVGLSGSAASDFVQTLSSAPDRTLEPGEYHVDVIPVSHPDDGYLPIRLSSKIEEPWKLCMMIVNRVL